MERSSKVVKAFRCVAAALALCAIVPVTFAEEKIKSVWVKADELMAQEKYDEAVKLYTVAIEINAEDPEIYNAYFNRGQAFMFLGMVDEALVDYTDTIRLGTRWEPVTLNRQQRRSLLCLKSNPTMPRPMYARASWP